MAAQPMTPANLPSVIATCRHCGQELYANAPVRILASPNEITMAHVACERDQHRTGQQPG